MQRDNPAYKWGVTDVLLEAVPPPPASDLDIGLLVIDGATVTDEFGNNFNGHNDAETN